MLKQDNSDKSTFTEMEYQEDNIYEFFKNGFGKIKFFN